TDASGNTNACTFHVTVTDNEAPVIGACPANITQTNDVGSCTAVVTFTTPSATDNCSGVMVSCLPASGATFPKGPTTVTCTATDASMNTNACTFTVTVTDAQAPTISCPGDITVTNSPGSCASNVVFTATPLDNCPGVTYACVPASGSSFPKGPTLVTCTATDASGN